MASRQRLVEKGQTQASGMREIDSTILAKVPYSADQVSQASTELSTITLSQEKAKADLHSLTQDAKVKDKALREMVARNVSYFQGVLGKKDPRLPLLGARVLVHKGGRPRKPKEKSGEAASKESTTTNHTATNEPPVK